MVFGSCYLFFLLRTSNFNSHYFLLPLKLPYKSVITTVDEHLSPLPSLCLPRCSFIENCIKNWRRFTMFQTTERLSSVVLLIPKFFISLTLPLRIKTYSSLAQKWKAFEKYPLLQMPSFRLSFNKIALLKTSIRILKSSVRRSVKIAGFFSSFFISLNLKLLRNHSSASSILVLE